MRKEEVLEKKIAYSNKDCYFVNKLFSIKPTNEIDSKYIYYYTLSNVFQKKFKESLHGLIGGVSLSKIKNFQIVYPSLSEQQHIVAKLDAIFADINKALDTTINSQKNINYITQLFFNNIENKNINNLCENNIGELCDLMTGGTPNTKNQSYYIGGKIPWLVSGDVNKNIINDCEGRITELG